MRMIEGVEKKKYSRSCADCTKVVVSVEILVIARDSGSYRISEQRRF